MTAPGRGLERRVPSHISLFSSGLAGTVPQMGRSTLWRAVEDLTGQRCVDERELHGGASSSRTYRFDLADGTAIAVKVNAEERTLSRSTQNLRVLADLGVRVPKLVAFDPSRSRHPEVILIMEYLDGRELGRVLDELSAAELHAIASEVVEAQRRVRALPANNGCGFVGIGETADRSWIDVVRRPNNWPIADPIPRDAADLVPRLDEALHLAEPYFARVEPTAFLDDATTKNVLVRDGRFVGIVDLDVICYGDPLFHLGLTAAAVTADSERPASKAYVDHLMRLSNLTPFDVRIVGLYEALFLTNFLVAEHPHKPGAWRERAIAGASDRLTSFCADPPRGSAIEDGRHAP